MTLPRPRTATALLGLAAALAVAAPSPASGAGPSTSTGTVTRGADGDTVWVDIAGDGTGPVKVRNAGIQALEIGQCGAARAKTRLDQLVLGKKVRLTAEHATSRAGGRPLRFLDVVTRTGVTDVQAVLLREGLVLWEDIGREDGRSAAYQRAMEGAAAAGRGIWDDDRCGAGPASTARTRMWIHYDGEGSDGEDPNVEYVRVQNTGTTVLPLGGWWVREGAGRHTVRFPAGTVVRPGDHVTLHTGHGTPTSDTFYFRSASPIFGNISSPAAPGETGDGIYLFDPHGDIRSHVTYPCVLSCTDPAAGRLALAPVVYDPPGDDGSHPEDETIAITVVGREPVDLTRTVLVVGSHVMEMPVGTVLRPGERMEVRSGRGTPSRLRRYWQSRGPLLSNRGGVAHLRNSEGTPLACRSWAGGRC